MVNICLTGLVSFDEARSYIASGKELRDRIRPELERFFDTPGPHAVAELFKHMHAAAIESFGMILACGVAIAVQRREREMDGTG